MGLLEWSLFFGGLLLYWEVFPPRLPIETANGDYANPCCGSLTFKNGRMIVNNGQQVGYVVEYDKEGRYVLPTSYVGVLDARGIQIDSSASPLKLRLDDATQPTSVELFGDSAIFSFERIKMNGGMSGTSGG